jgi:hypothetical protein
MRSTKYLQERYRESVRSTAQVELESDTYRFKRTRGSLFYIAWDHPDWRQMMADSTSTSEEQRPNPNEKLVRVFDTEQESEAMIVRGLLESSGIDSDLTSLDAQQDILPGVGGTVILVREEDEAEARRLIEEYRQTPEEIETAEIALNEEPPAEG